MKRKMSKELLKWKNDKEKMPLIVYGARQVGKHIQYYHLEKKITKM